MTETLTHGYSSESIQQELSNEYQHESLCFHKSLRPSALDVGFLSIGSVKSIFFQSCLTQCGCIAR